MSIYLGTCQAMTYCGIPINEFKFQTTEEFNQQIEVNFGNWKKREERQEEGGELEGDESLREDPSEEFKEHQEELRKKENSKIENPQIISTKLERPPTQTPIVSKGSSTSTHHPLQGNGNKSQTQG